MTAFEFLSDKIPHLTESSQLRWRNPDYAPSRYRRADDICAEIENFYADVAGIAKSSVDYNELQQLCYEKCFGYIVLN